MRVKKMQVSWWTNFIMKNPRLGISKKTDSHTDRLKTQLLLLFHIVPFIHSSTHPKGYHPPRNKTTMNTRNVCGGRMNVWMWTQKQHENDNKVQGNQKDRAPTWSLHSFCLYYSAVPCQLPFTLASPSRCSCFMSVCQLAQTFSVGQLQCKCDSVE